MHRTLFFVIFSLGLVPRAWGVADAGLWYDEVWSWVIADADAGRMGRILLDPESSHPPLYYLLLRGWVAAWGESEAAMRSLAVLCGGATLLGMYWAGRAVADLDTESRVDDRAARRAGLITMAFTAAALTQIEAARQVRMYALGTALIAASSGLLARVVRPGANGFWWPAAYTLTALALCYTHALGSLVVAAEGAYLAGWFLLKNRRLGRTVGAVGLALAAGYAPMLTLQADKARGATWPEPLSYEGLVHDVSQTVLTDFRSPFPAAPGFDSLVTLAVLTLLVLGVRGKSWAGRYWCGSGLMVFLAMLAFSLAAGKSIIGARQLTFAHLLGLGAAGHAVANLGQIGRGLTIAAVAAVLTLVCYPTAGRVAAPDQTGMRAAAAFIAARVRPDDLVVVTWTNPYLKLRYYLPGRQNVKLLTTLPCRRLQAHSAWLTDADLLNVDEFLTEGAPRVWVVSTHWNGLDLGTPHPVPRDWVLAEFYVASEPFYVEGPIHVRQYRTGAGRGPVQAE